MNLEKISGTNKTIGVSDEKARRVLNTSKKQANITAEEIEAGITSERLETIGVPVYRYATCCTIHGILPDFNPNKRIGGYKALSQNQNGTLGLRYIAIDNAKKKTIQQRLHYGVAKYRATLSSTGFSISKCFGDYTAENLETAKAELEKLPTTFTGTAYLGAERPMWGGTPQLWIDIFVGAIPAAEVDRFSEHICGCSLMEIDAKIQAKEAEAIAAQEAREKRWAIERIQRTEKQKELEKMVFGGYKKPGSYKRFFVDNPSVEGKYVIVSERVEIEPYGKNFKVVFLDGYDRHKKRIIEAATVKGWKLNAVSETKGVE